MCDSPPRPRPAPWPRHLVRRVTCLGDVLLSLHVAKALKRADPECHVAFSTSSQYADVPRHCEYVDEVLLDGCEHSGGFASVYDLDGRHRFDHLAGEGEIERLDLIARGTGLPVVAGPPPYAVRDEERRDIERFLAVARVPPGTRLVGIAPGSSSPKRHRSPTATRRLAQDVLAAFADVHLVLIDSPRATWHDVGLDDPRMANACGNLTLPQLAALLERLRLLITCDSGPLHLASISATPQVAFFSEIRPEARVTAYPCVRPAYSRSSCEYWPCGYYRDCRHQACINDVSFSEFAWVAESVLSDDTQASDGARPVIEVHPQRFCALYVGSVSADRALGDLARCFASTFSADDPVSLILLTPNHGRGWPSRMHDALRVARRRSSAPEIVWKRLEWEPRSWRSYMRRAAERGLVVVEDGDGGGVLAREAALEGAEAVGLSQAARRIACAARELTGERKPLVAAPQA